MLSADEIRRNMPSCQPATKEEFLNAIEQRAVAAAKQGAISIWVTWKDGYRENPTVAFQQGLNELRNKGYRLVEDEHNGKPAIRIYWEEEPKPSEWEIKNVPRTFRELTLHVFSSGMVGAVFLGMLAILIVGVRNILNGSSTDSYEVGTHYAALGFVIFALLGWLCDTGNDVRVKKEAS